MYGLVAARWLGWNWCWWDGGAPRVLPGAQSLLGQAQAVAASAGLEYWLLFSFRGQRNQSYRRPKSLRSPPTPPDNQLKKKTRKRLSRKLIQGSCKITQCVQITWQRQAWRRAAFGLWVYTAFLSQKSPKGGRTVVLVLQWGIWGV